uniref:PucR family transcriptional regulator n=1 Tax=candidate division WWE3 bacterium TaxID=2053526 RepID=A0A7C4XNP1_UNCKA
MEKELAERIIHELCKFSTKRYAVCDASGSVLATTEDFSILHNPLDIKGSRSIPIYFEKNKVGYLYMDENLAIVKEFGSVAKSMAELIIQQSYFSDLLTSDEKRLDQIVYDFLNTDSLKHEDFRRITKSFGIKIELDRIAILVEISDPDYLFLYAKEIIEGEREKKIARIKRGIESVLSSFYTRHKENVVCYLGGSNFLILKDMGSDGSGHQDEFKKTLNSLFYDLKQELRTNISVGVGDFNKGIGGLKESYDEAKTALAFGKQIWGKEKIYHFDNFGVVAPLFSGANSDNIGFSRNIIKKLKEHSDLYGSLDCYFKNDLSLSKTSSKLKIHRNTLVYRLERIAEITNLDPRIFNEAFQLQIALILERYNEKP